MATGPFIVSGVVHEGVVVPETPLNLPEGSPVRILVADGTIPAALRVEFDSWELLSDEAWSQIDEWEQAQKP